MEFSAGDYVILNDKNEPAVITRIWKDVSYLRVGYCDRDGSLAEKHVQAWMVRHPTIEETLSLVHLFRKVKDKLKELDRLNE